MLHDVQMLFLTVRPRVLACTLRHVRRDLPFVGEIVVVCPQRLSKEIRQLDVTVVEDETLVPGGLSADHATRNLQLRRSLLDGPWIDGSFLMSDDDYRPLRPIDPEFFVEEGRHHLYWFHHLDRWPNVATSFDHAQVHTAEILRQRRAPMRAFASHQPQIIDRDLFRRVLDDVASAVGSRSVCEWSLYGNLAPLLEPNRFWDPSPYETLAWPENPASWLAAAVPPTYSFENTYAEHYGDTGVFSGIDEDAYGPDVALEKAIRWRRYAIEVGERRRLPDVGAEPPTSARRLAERVAAPAQRVMQRLLADHGARLDAIERRLSGRD